MFLFNRSSNKAEKILASIEDFEACCLGKKDMSPKQFQSLNRELSMNAVLNIGRHRLSYKTDGRHLIWRSPDNREYDLGKVEDLNVFRDYPGFHKRRSLSLGQDHVTKSEVIDAPGSRQKLSVVKMKDGSKGIGPNYKIALRNAAMKMHLREQFHKQNPTNLWKDFYGYA